MLAQDYVQLYTTKSLLSRRGNGTCSWISLSLSLLLQISLHMYPYTSFLWPIPPYSSSVVSGFKWKTREWMDLPRISKEKESSQSWIKGVVGEKVLNDKENTLLAGIE